MPELTNEQKQKLDEAEAALETYKEMSQELYGCECLECLELVKSEARSNAVKAILEEAAREGKI